MNRKQLLLEIEDLSRIPGFERIFYHKVKELKENISRNPGYYFEILEKQEREMQAYPDGEIEFELHRFGKSVWIPVLPDNDFCAYEFVTDEIIDYIIGIEAAPGMPHMRNNLSIEEGRKTIDPPGCRKRAFGKREIGAEQAWNPSGSGKILRVCQRIS